MPNCQELEGSRKEGLSDLRDGSKLKLLRACLVSTNLRQKGFLTNNSIKYGGIGFNRKYSESLLIYNLSIVEEIL